MQRCKTCKHWGVEPFYADRRLKGCTAPGIVRGYVEPEDVPDNGAGVEDDEGWAIETGPEFGCVLHEKAGA